MAVPMYVYCQSGRKEFLWVVQGKQSILMIFPGKFLECIVKAAQLLKGKEMSGLRWLEASPVEWSVLTWELAFKPKSYTYLLIIQI